MTYTIRQANPKPAAFTRRGRPGGARGIHQMQIHATRGPVPIDRQVQATENWFSQQPDRGGWGSSADFVVGPDRRVGGKVVIVQFGDWLRTFGSWSAGYGGLGAAREWGAAEVGVAIEVAQPDNSTAFTTETLEAVTWLCGEINRELVAAGGVAIPPVHLPYWDQLRTKPVPRGYLGHDELANGRKLGKSDPGRMWNWDTFIAGLAPESPGLSPAVTNLEAALAAYYDGVHPLPIKDGAHRYELRMEP